MMNRTMNFRADEAWSSVADRKLRPARLLTRPCQAAKSSARDLHERTVKLPAAVWVPRPWFSSADVNRIVAVGGDFAG